jgi:hypothetical protein
MHATWSWTSCRHFSSASDMLNLRKQSSLARFVSGHAQHLRERVSRVQEMRRKTKDVRLETLRVERIHFRVGRVVWFWVVSAWCRTAGPPGRYLDGSQGHSAEKSREKISTSLAEHHQREFSRSTVTRTSLHHPVVASSHENTSIFNVDIRSPKPCSARYCERCGRQSDTYK